MSRIAALAIARRRRADGGLIKSAKVHEGPIHSSVAGRTDHLPVNVRSGSYVLPADIVSGLGEGNSLAGFKIVNSMFRAPNRTQGAPYGESGLPYGGPTPEKADGGSVDDGSDVPIVAAGGEAVLSPEDVMHATEAPLDEGHKILDEFVKQYRQKLIGTLKALPGPRRN